MSDPNYTTGMVPGMAQEIDRERAEDEREAQAEASEHPAPSPFPPKTLENLRQIKISLDAAIGQLRQASDYIRDILRWPGGDEPIWPAKPPDPPDPAPPWLRNHDPIIMSPNGRPAG
jgi:hypothetical protein